MATNVSITTQALLLIGADTISSFADDSNEAEIANVLYEPFIKSLLSSYPWTFATRKRQLNQDTATPTNEYTYSHIIPAEALLLWAVFNDDGIGAVPIKDYDIYADTTGALRRVYSNHPTLYADYTIYISENNWPPYFEQFAIHALAAHLAMPVTRNAELADYFKKAAYGSLNSNMKGGLFGVAAATDAKQKRNEYIISSPLTEARFS